MSDCFSLHNPQLLLIESMSIVSGFIDSGLLNILNPPCVTHQGCSGRRQDHHLLQIVANTHQKQMGPIPLKPHIPNCIYPIVPLQRSKNPLHGRTNPGNPLIPFPLSYG